MNKILYSILLVIVIACSKSEDQHQPNVLWLTFEDTSPQFIGCYGNQNAHTPIMDKLASNGVRFTAAFSTGTVCSPSRFTLITGCRTTRYGTGRHRSNYAIPDEIEAFPKYLRNAGYYTTNNSKTDYNTSKYSYFVKSGWDESSNKAGWWNRKPGQPFFAVFNSIHSHQSRTMTNPWWKYKEQVLDNLNEKDIIDQNDIEVPPIFKDTPEMRKEISRIYNSIQLTDNHFGEILKKLEDDGLADSTIIFCFSDHGEGMPWGKTYPRAMGYRVPFIIYFPEMYKHLSPWGTKVITSDIVDFADLPATVLSLAGVEIPNYMDGNALLGKAAVKAKKYSYGALDRTGENTTLCRSISDGTFIYNKNFMPFQPEKRWQKYFDYSQVSQNIRNDYSAKKLNEVQSGLLEIKSAETFYNLNDDPWETKNLVDNKEFKSKIEKFRKNLKEDLIKQRDAHFIPEYSVIEKQKSPNELSQDENFYPASEIINLAFLCGQKDELPQFINGLAHENEIIRYWSAIGIYSHAVLFGLEGADLSLKDDTYEPAEIFLQATKAQFINDKMATEKLLNYLKGNNEQLGMLAAQVLIQDEFLNTELKNTIIEICKNSEIAELKQYGELFEYKFNNTPLVYTTFW